ncbi:vWA domain-containing protein [Tropicibacter sp. S64]|uniref:vWA domain-containing protein n=1 Tax=Tropicibacter sp. S64 TaxID=3415122 RepID=UPI003C7E320E
MHRKLTRPVQKASAALGAVFLFASALAAPAGSECSTDAMIVFDGSGSMAEMGFNKIGEPRIFEAREALHSVLPQIAAMRRLGLVVYGPGGDGECKSTELYFGPRPNAAPPITAAVDALDPTGSTPLTEGVRLAAEALKYRERPGAIVLVTDGDETCGGAPCQLAAQLAAEGLDLTVHVIGFKVRPTRFSWDGARDTEAVSNAACLAEATGGEYLGVESVEELIGALRVTLGCPVFGALD